MNNKKIILFFLLSLLGLVIGYLITNSVKFGYCLHEQYSCRESLNRIGDSLYFSMPALALVFLVLLFTPYARKAWSKFAKWFIPIGIIIFISYNGPGSGDFLAPYPEELFKWVSILYVGISLVIIFSSFNKK